MSAPFFTRAGPRERKPLSVAPRFDFWRGGQIAPEQTGTCRFPETRLVHVNSAPRGQLIRPLLSRRIGRQGHFLFLISQVLLRTLRLSCARLATIGPYFAIAACHLSRGA